MVYVTDGVRDVVYEPETVIGVFDTVRDFVRVGESVRLGDTVLVTCLLVARGVGVRVVDTLSVRDWLPVSV
jgi:hypothetical protein